MTFADKIKTLCKQKDISVSQLERDLGFGNGYVLTLKDKIPTNRAVMIAEYFGLPSDYFMPDKIKKSPASQNPLIDEIILKASSLNETELQELLSFVGYIQSKHSNT